MGAGGVEEGDSGDVDEDTLAQVEIPGFVDIRIPHMMLMRRGRHMRPGVSALTVQSLPCEEDSEALTMDGEAGL